ncbi:MAG TPA: SRPBCC family protein [Candidatus Dormibacteraeota bacterium]|nr:SRPBCC family protein [Candidatus Dormibacteraeota bacterium]
MYIEHSVHVAHPIKACSDALLEGPRKWFPRIGDKNVSKVGVHVAGVPIRKRVAVELGEPVKTSTWTVIPLTWKATFPEKLFPEMTGKIELSPSDPDVTRLTVSGMYEPPLGSLGRQLDQALMHNVAEATVKELAVSIAARLEKALKGEGRTPG